MQPLIEIDVPATPDHECLDDYLRLGWFRNGYYMAIAPLVLMDGDVFPVLSVRARLEGYRFRKSLRRVLRRGHDRFRVEIGPAYTDDARERLYEFGAERFFGYMMGSLDELLAAEPFDELFDTEEVAVYDGARLVAISYFDSGRTSVASLLGLYDPEYSSYGLGVFTMLLEVEYAIEHGYHYYYPGFVTHGHDRMDYKLRLDALQYLDGGGRWRALERTPHKNRWRERIVRRTAELERRLAAARVEARRRANPYFLFASLGIAEADPVEGPIYFQCDPLEGDPARVIVEYVVDRDCYAVARVRRSAELAEMIDARLSPEGQHPVYAREPLERDAVYWEGEDASEAVQQVLAVMDRAAAHSAD